MPGQKERAKRAENLHNPMQDENRACFCEARGGIYCAPAVATAAFLTMVAPWQASPLLTSVYLIPFFRG